MVHGDNPVGKGQCSYSPVPLNTCLAAPLAGAGRALRSLACPVPFNSYRRYGFAFLPFSFLDFVLGPRARCPVSGHTAHKRD